LSTDDYLSRENRSVLPLLKTSPPPRPVVFAWSVFGVPGAGSVTVASFPPNSVLLLFPLSTVLEVMGCFTFFFLFPYPFLTYLEVFSAAFPFMAFVASVGNLFPPTLTKPAGGRGHFNPVFFFNVTVLGQCLFSSRFPFHVFARDYLGPCLFLYPFPFLMVALFLVGILCFFGPFFLTHCG